jgi:hypothetical protein
MTFPAICLIVGLLLAPTVQGELVYRLPFQDGGNNATLDNFGTAGGTATTYGPNAGGYTNATAPFTFGGAWARDLLSVSGNYSPALELPDSSSRFNMTSTGDRITVAAWIKLKHSSGSYQGIATKVQDSGNEKSWCFGLYGGQLFFYTAIDGTWLDNKGAVSAETWTHVAMTWQAGSTITFYVNGASTGSGTANACTGAGGKPFRIGFYNTGQASQLDGLVDDYRVYDTILTAAEIKALALPSGLLYHLPFQTSSNAATLANFGTAGGTATLVGGASYTNRALRLAGGEWAMALTNSGNGNTPYLVLPNGSALLKMNAAGDKMTVAGWVRCVAGTHPSQYRGIIARNDNYYANSWGVTIYDNALYVKANGSHVISGLDLAGGFFSAWQHIALTWEAGGNLQFYQNGLLRSVVTNVVPCTAAGNLLHIGAAGSNPANCRFDGLVDDFRIYDSVLSQPQIQALCTGLVHHLPFQDAGGNATLEDFGMTGDPIEVDSGSTLATNDTPPGVGGTYARQLVGNNGCLRFGSSYPHYYLNGPTGAITAAAWVKFNPAAAGWRGILSKKTSNYYAANWFLAGYGYSDNNISLVFRGTTNALGDGSSQSWLETTARMATGAWHHVALAWQPGAELVLYVNGVGQSFGVHPPTVGASAGFPFLIGMTTPGSSGGLNGKMDDLRIYNYVLTSNEVSALRFPVTVAPPRGTVFYLR